ncbi:YdcF family protein [Thermodesulfobacterium sp. TA1]|uniref:YdcF family protein n=1 Tax=Thermodesulfobacterium sp. TA1 TaxID=2234087 RepID=UPI001231D78B|nr:YdcF family protein [Thermodesulfobacterium sp. TA1]QER42202.1 YdcF family protein [Thermodesulfobacterium sp. TA1]
MSDLFFIIKKFFVFLFRPSSLIFLFLLTVSIYVVLGKRRGRRRFFLFVAVALYYLSTTPFLPYFLLKQLEKNYPIPPQEEIAKVEKIIVLTGRVYGQKDLGLEERFSKETLVRFFKALELKKVYPEKKVIIVGGSYEDLNFKGASYLKEFAGKLGYQVEAIDIPLDTETSVKTIKKLLSSPEERFLLLTSAYHLPRAIILFKKEGLNPIPYPTNYNHKLCKPDFSVSNFFPNDLYFSLTNLAFHEYLGILFYKIKFLLF